MFFQYSKRCVGGGGLLNGNVAMVTATLCRSHPPMFAHCSLFRIIPGVAAHSSFITACVLSLYPEAHLSYPALQLIIYLPNTRTCISRLVRTLNDVQCTHTPVETLCCG